GQLAPVLAHRLAHGVDDVVALLEAALPEALERLARGGDRVVDRGEDAVAERGAAALDLRRRRTGRRGCGALAHSPAHALENGADLVVAHQAHFLDFPLLADLRLFASPPPPLFG